MLGEKLSVLKAGLTEGIVLGIPRGGLYIAQEIAKSLKLPWDAAILRKLPIPEEPEAGFGAVSIDKTVVLNEEILPRLNLNQDQINKIINTVYQEVLRRNKLYRKDKPFPALAGRSVILADDGLATGFSMLAAVQLARKNKPREIIVAVPVAHRQAYELIKKAADSLVALHVSDRPYFAVASFYSEFPEASDAETSGLLERQYA